jgi:nicotinate phosphoribosyltransferase
LHFDHTHKGELASFIMFAKSFPDNYFTLIDTYNTLKSGILNTIIVVKAMFEIRMSVQKIGVRLDSGDLVAQSKACR